MKSISHLSNGSVLYLKEMIRGLALVALIRSDERKGMNGVEEEAHGMVETIEEIDQDQNPIKRNH